MVNSDRSTLVKVAPDCLAFDRDILQEILQILTHTVED